MMAFQGASAQYVLRENQMKRSGGLGPRNLEHVLLLGAADIWTLRG